MRPITGLDSRFGVVSASLAFYAVLVFFVLSGYLITNSLLLNWQRNGSLDVLTFLSARALRILPPFVFAVLLSLGVSIGISVFCLHGHDTFRLPTDLYVVRDNVQLVGRDVIFSVLLSNGVVPGTNSIITNGALWSLSIEVWLYFIALLIALAWEGRFRDKTALTALIGLVGILLLLSYKPLLFEFGVYWFLGAAFRLHREFPKGKILKRVSFALIAVPGLLLCLKNPALLNPSNQASLSLPVNISVLIILTGILYLIPGRFTLWQAPGQFLAHSSYTLYIIHFPILTFLFSLFHQQFVNWDQNARILFLLGVTVLNLAIAHFAALVLEDRSRWKNLIKIAISKS